MARKSTKKIKTLKDKYIDVLPNIDDLKCVVFKFNSQSQQYCFHFDVMSNNDKIKYDMYDGVDSTATIFFHDDESIEQAKTIARNLYGVEGYTPNLIMLV